MPEADVYVMHFTILMPVSVVISPRVVHSWCLTCLGAEYYFFPGSSAQPFISNDAFLLGGKKGHTVGFLSSGNPWIFT